MKSTPLRWSAVILVATIACVAIAHAKPATMRKFARTYDGVKESKLNACATCHVGTGVELNPYGQALEGADGEFASIEKSDSDGDGAINLDEIRAVSFPGDAKDKPGKAAADSSGKAGADSSSAKPDSSGKAEPDSSGRKAKPEKEDEHHGGGGKPRFPWSPGFTTISHAPDTIWMLAAHEPTTAR